MKRYFPTAVAAMTAAFLFVSPLSSFEPGGVSAQERLRAQRATRQIDPPALQLAAGVEDDDALAPSVARTSKPKRRGRIGKMNRRTVQTGDNSTEQLSELVVRAFEEHEAFASSLSRKKMVGKGILTLPEVDDEVVEYEDSYVIRRSTTIVVLDPAQVARQSSMYRDYLGQRPRRARSATPAELDAEELAGLRAFMANEVNQLDRRDPIRRAAARGEEAVLNAIISGQGRLTIQDTLVVPKRAGVDQGSVVRIPTIRAGVMDLRSPEPVRAMEIKSLAVDPSPPPQLKLRATAQPRQPKKPKRAQLPPTHSASGKEVITAEFLAGVTRAANFQWERRWEYPSGYFRFTVGTGYAFGYRAPVVAHAVIEPTDALIRDYEDKKVVIGAAASAETVDGNANFYKRAGLSDNEVQNGRELLLEANVGYGYKFRAFWKTLLYRPYTAIGLSYSQNFRPPMNGDINCGSCDFVVSLDPSTTQMTLNLPLLKGSAWIRFDGRTSGQLAMNMDTLVDNKPQNTFALGNADVPQGAYPFKLTLDPKPLRAGTTVQVRPYGVRINDLSYKARLVIVPLVRLGLSVGYKSLSLNFNTGWIPLNGLRIDTGTMDLHRHAGTRAQYVWNDGKKTYHHLDRPPGQLGVTSGAPNGTKPKRATRKP